MLDPAAASVVEDSLGLVGTILDGRYRVDHVIGRGGFGVVYRAHHLRFDAPVAIKALAVPENEHFVQTMISEGKLLFSLSSLHPSIVQVLEMGVTETSANRLVPYLVLEWLNGVSLEEELDAREDSTLAPLSLAQVIQLLAAPVRGLCYAHAKGIVHRDIKPGNLFLCNHDNELRVKLLDFGLAKVMTESLRVSQGLVDTLGIDTPFTPAYAAPEQWLRRLGATGPWTDVFSLALVCVELLIGKRALIGDDKAQVMAACLDQMRPTPAFHSLLLSTELEAVFEKALALKPKDRYPDVSQFWTALESLAPKEVPEPIQFISFDKNSNLVLAQDIDLPSKKQPSNGESGRRFWARQSPLADSFATQSAHQSGSAAIFSDYSTISKPAPKRLFRTTAIAAATAIGLLSVSFYSIVSGNRNSHASNSALPGADSAIFSIIIPPSAAAPAASAPAAAASLSASSTDAVIPQRAIVPSRNPKQAARPSASAVVAAPVASPGQQGSGLQGLINDDQLKNRN